jgi:hypothetical protein
MKKTSLRTLLVAAVFCVSIAGRASGSQDVFVSYANSAPVNVHRFDASGADLGAFVSSGFSNFPTGLAFDASGNLFASDYNPGGGGSIHKFSPTGVDLGIFGGGVDRPFGLAFDAGGNLNVAAFGSSQIRKYDSTGTFLGFLPASGGGQGPFDIALDSSGNLYAALRYGNFVAKYDSSGASLGTIATPAPIGLAVDSGGNLFVSNSTINEIHKFGPTGSDLGVFASVGLNGPGDIAIDLADNVYVANSGDSTIRKFGPNGANLGVFASSTGQAGWLTLSRGVPEPGSLFLGLLASVGFLLRRQR